MYSGMNITMPRKAMLITNEASAVMRNVRIRNKCSGRIGSTACASTHRKIVSPTAPATNRPMMQGESHGYDVPPSVSARRSAAAVITTSAAPR
jgi:hypothetical protein